MIKITYIYSLQEKSRKPKISNDRMKFKTVWLWPLIDTLNSSIYWDNLRERLSVTTTVHDVPTIDI